MAPFKPGHRRLRHWVPWVLTILVTACNSSNKPDPDCGLGEDGSPPCKVVPQILATFDHDPRAFTQGLEINHGVLYESTGQFGSSTLRRVNLATGEVLQSIDLPEDLFGEGLTIMGDKIFVLTWLSERGFVFNKHTFEQLETFVYEGQGWGLTNNGTELIMSNGSSTLQFLDPESFEVKRTLEVKSAGEDGSSSSVTSLNELEYVDGFIYSNRYLRSTIVKVNASTGYVSVQYDLESLAAQTNDVCAGSIDVLNGIAYDARTGAFYVTGKDWCRLYEVSWSGEGSGGF